LKQTAELQRQQYTIQKNEFQLLLRR